jgi:serine/threonine protein kinase
MKDIQVKDRLAEGSYGVVFKGMHKGSEVAIKKLKRSETSEEIEHEVKILNTVQHPNILRFIGVGILDDQMLIVTEYMEDGSLDQILFKGKPKYTDSKYHVRLSFKRKMEILTDVAKGMEYLHSFTPKKIYHRDLKPNNILLDKDGTAKVIMIANQPLT